MKAFFSKYSYTMVKLFLNQFAIALFGIALAFACGMTENVALRTASSVFAVLFYLFLLYAAMWEVGAKDGISADAGKMKRCAWRGFLIALAANIPNLLFALLNLLGVFAPGSAAMQGVSSVGKLIALLLQGMYIGILALPLKGLALNAYAFSYFLIILPAVVVCGIAYLLGTHQWHLTNILIPKNKDVKNNGRPK